MVDHLLEAALAQRKELRDHTHVALRHVYRQLLHWLVQSAVYLACEHLRLAHRQLEALSAHQLHQDR